MLTRAAKNAYSWWWASHIRTKQSKWLEHNIQEMEEKVDYILKIITEDGDSFRVRAEQYYRKRPEIVNFVEDTFRGYRALAERYDHLSKELQSANRTIAVVFPERVQMSIDEEDFEDLMLNPDEHENKLPPSSNVPLPLPLPLPPKPNSAPKMENVVQAMIKKKSQMPTKMMSKKGLIKLGVEEKTPGGSKSSGLSKDDALDEIDRLQKDILGLQTEKEFVKSSYETSATKYWEIEDNVTEMHTKISNLQDEFKVGAMIEDTDAQRLMSSSALKTCQETITKIKNKQQRYKKEAAVEHRRVDDIRKKFEALITKNNDNSVQKNLEQTMEEHVKDKKAKIEEKIGENDALIQQDSDGNHQENDQLEADQSIEDKKAKIKEEIIGDNKPITISQVAEKIEQLVDKVINLETEVTSQAALVMRLRLENDELHEHLQRVEHEKKMLVDDSNDMNIKIKRLEEDLKRVQALDQIVKGQNVQLEATFDEAGVGVESLSKDLSVAKPDEKTPEDENPPKNHEFEEENEELKSSEEILGEKDEGDDSKLRDQSRALTKQVVNDDEDVDHGEEDQPDWNLTMLLDEYTTTLRNYKEVKKKLNEIEKRNRASSFRSAVQMKMLRNSNESKDAEIQSLYEKLKLFEMNVVDKTIDFEVRKGRDSVDEGIERRNGHEEPVDFELKNGPDSVDEGTQRSKEVNEPADFKLKEARDLVDERIERRGLEAVEFELKKARDLVDEVVERRKGLETIEFELKKAQDSVDEEIERRKGLETVDREPKKARDLVDEGMERRKGIETVEFELKKPPDSDDEGTERRKGLKTVEIELKKARDLVDEVVQRRKELETVELELKKARDSVDERTQTRKEVDEIEYFEPEEPPDSIDERTHRKEPDHEVEYFELDEAPDSIDERTNRKEPDEIAEFDFKTAPDSVEEGRQRRKELGEDVDDYEPEPHQVSDIEEAIRREIDDFAKENMELWLRFSTSYHQINRFQDSYHDLLQEIKEVKEQKRHHQHHSSSLTSDLRPIYRHLRDMETELTLWLEKSAILDDDLQHRLASLSDIQDEISNLINDTSKTEPPATATTLSDYQSAKFQGEVMNMKQENEKVLEELRAASERVKRLLVDMEKTLAMLDEELGKKKRSSSRIPLRSFLFGVKLRKHKPSLFTCMNPSLQRQYSDNRTLPPEPPHR